MITSTEFTAQDNFNTTYNTFRGDLLAAHGIDRNKKGVRIAPGAIALQANFDGTWVTTTRDTKDEMRYQATGNKAYRLIARVA